MHKASVRAREGTRPFAQPIAARGRDRPNTVQAERGFLVSDGAKRWKGTEWPSIPAVRYVCRGGGAAEGHGGLLYLPYKTQALFPPDFGEKKCVLYGEKYGNS